MRELIGERAERLAYLNSAMTRTTFDATVEQGSGPHSMIDRFTGKRITFSPQEFEDLLNVHLCDWLEQVERYGEWDSRRAAFRRIAERLGGIALDSYDEVFRPRASCFHVRVCRGVIRKESCPGPAIGVGCESPSTSAFDTCAGNRSNNLLKDCT